MYKTKNYNVPGSNSAFKILNNLPPAPNSSFQPGDPLGVGTSLKSRVDGRG